MSTDTSSTANLAQAYNTANRLLRWAEQPPPPPVEKLREYAAQLADIYVDILKAFQDSGPLRTEGEPVAYGTIQNHLLNEGKTYTEPEVGLAVDKLVGSGFLTQHGVRMLYAPTRTGEALIGVITGTHATPVTVPELPNPTW